MLCFPDSPRSEPYAAPGGPNQAGNVSPLSRVGRTVLVTKRRRFRLRREQEPAEVENSVLFRIMADRKIDAFILFNERESAVQEVVDELERRAVSTYFWRQDIEAGQEWQSIEARNLAAARTVLVFLGPEGWGATHLKLAREAQQLAKPLIPVLLGDPPPGDAEKLGGLFTTRRYIELRQRDSAAMDLLVRSIRSLGIGVDAEPQLDGVIRTIVDGNESERLGLLEQIRISKRLNRPALSRRLRTVLLERFGPGEEGKLEAADRDPKKISSIRSWLLSFLIWTDPDDPDNRKLLLNHLAPVGADGIPADRSIRFWILAGLFTAGATYVKDFAARLLDDAAPEVQMLAEAIVDISRAATRIRSALSQASFGVVWPALRTLRIVPMPELAEDLCIQLGRTDVDGPAAYDTLYALSNPPIAQAAAPLLVKTPGVAGLLRLIVEIAIDSDSNAARTFASLLAALPPEEVGPALETTRADPRFTEITDLIRGFLRALQSTGVGEALIAGYASDNIDVDHDALDIREDVYTLSAVMLSEDVKPPLAIGLFGDWGTGKSFFMQSMQKACEDLKTKPKFCHSIVQIEFNAWHYVETNLWASMVSYILERLAAEVSPAETQEQKEAALTKELRSAQTMVEEATGEKKRTQELIQNRAAELQKAQLERQQKEIALNELRASDIKEMIEDPANADLKKDLDNALKQMGVPAVLNSAADLARVVSEASSLRARVATLLQSIARGKNLWIAMALVAVTLVIIPLTAYFIRKQVQDGFFVQIGAVAAQIGAFLVGAKTILENGLKQVAARVEQFEKAKSRVDELLSKKRQEPSEAEKSLQQDIAALKATEEQSEARLSAAAARVVELEERIRAVQQGRSLAQFLTERTRSDDYRKHLGLVSTIRQDFDALSKRLGNPSPADKLYRVDRIILYIDDLDRCPEDKVMEVLQAVHLLLAYPLFVVVVAVDPRWLLHSLRQTYGAFRRNGKQRTGDRDPWRTTPQNYLEKIFQIPFSLRPMTSGGYDRLIGTLMSTRGDGGAREGTLGGGQTQTETVGRSTAVSTTGLTEQTIWAGRNRG